MRQISPGRILLGLVLSLFASLASASSASAFVYAPSGEEIQFSYTAQFFVDARKLQNKNTTPESLSKIHARHLFGLFSARTLIRHLGVDPDTIDGVAAPRSPQIQVTDVQTSSGKAYITYRIRGLMLAYRPVAYELVRHRTLTLPMPYDLENYTDPKCTDRDFPEYFWYEFDPWSKGCEKFSKEPLARNVEIRFDAPTARPASLDAHLDLLRGPNGNGSLFSIYVIHGFDESDTSRRDWGRRGFMDLNRYFKSIGMSEEIVNSHPSRSLYVYRRRIRGAAGTIDVEVRHLLVETAIESRGTTFAKFFREAIENADVLVYSGHSGLGEYLDIPALERKAGGFRFDAKKRQIFLFEACSSYSYYLPSFSSEKARGKVDIVTNGLASYFETGNDVLVSFFNSILDMNQRSESWDRILKGMEVPLHGRTFLLNVGAL